MTDGILHIRENREDLELHLKQNGKKFNKQCVHLMEQMYKGERFTYDIIYTRWKYDSRRLRDCRQHRPDIVKSRWEVDKDNKTRYVIFWIDVPRRPTKSESILWAENYLSNLKQSELFTNP